jgi:hypothetical protein
MANSKKDSDKGWGSEIEELRLRESLASQMGGPENLERQRAADAAIGRKAFAL